MESSQQKIRHIPIFVEGRDEPVINKGHTENDESRANNMSHNQNNQSSSNQNQNTSAFASAESSNHPFQQNYQSFGRPQMNFNDMGFGHDMPPSATGSIFERAKDFPVRDFFNDMRSSPRRSESPINTNLQQQQMPVRNPSGGRQNQSQERTIPVQHGVNRNSATPQRPPSQPRDIKRESSPQPSQFQSNEKDQNSVPAKQKAIEDSIAKIQKIQQSVMDLMARVEQYDGTNHKEYLYLDEMLTQNLLKLDNIDAEGKENIKNARREAIKCINHLISILEMKKDEALSRVSNNDNKDINNQMQSQSNKNEFQSAEESLEAKINNATKTDSK
jgi:hypothetical protein